MESVLLSSVEGRFHTGDRLRSRMLISKRRLSDCVLGSLSLATIVTR